jgi:hypothetical protein
MSPSPRLSGLLVRTMLEKGRIHFALLTTEAISTYSLRGGVYVSEMLIRP